MDPFIFVDTNIYLDFYRIVRKDVSKRYLEVLLKNRDVLIVTNQVEMEYKKNRQKVLMETISRIKNPDWASISAPAILEDSDPVKSLSTGKKEMNKQIGKLRSRVANIFSNPVRNDPVFKLSRDIFNYKSELNLNRTTKIRFDIRELAKKRFLLGYPPRKDKDNSIGDAVNWEWIVHVCSKYKKDVYIVSRDTDYGEFYNDKGYINDWLKTEFKSRVGARKRVILTNKLAIALKDIKEPVSKDMIDAEKEIIKERQQEVKTREVTDLGPLKIK